MSDLENEILEIIQSNYNSFKGTNEAELQSASDINELIKKQIIKGKIEVLEEYADMAHVRTKIKALKAELKNTN